MKMVYTHENRMIVCNAKNILEAQGIEVVIRNEFSSSAIGEISAFDVWVEVWVKNDADYSRAFNILETSLSLENAAEWVCSQCSEENDASFEVCWNCQHERS